MPVDADKPMTEEQPQRALPVARAARPRVPAIDRRWLPAVALAALVFSGLCGFGLRGALSSRRRRLDFPPLAKLNARIVGAQEKLKGNPQDLDALLELGTLHFQKGKEYYADAINELEEARELGALDPRLFYCLGVMYQEAGLYAFALEDYKRFLRHFPEDKEIRLLSAKLLYKQGAFREAVQEYERLKFRFPRDPLVEENLGLSLWQAKELDRASESFAQLRAMGPDQAKRADFYVGEIALEKGDASNALDHLLRAQPEAGRDIGIAPDRLATALATAYQKLGQLPEARAAWERVLTLTPNDAKAKAALRDVNRRLPSKKNKKR